MNLFINTAYSSIEFYIFNNKYSKLYIKESKNNHTIILYELFQKLLKKEKLTISQISKIYIINGPGSFTGLRVGVVFAKTLAKELKIPIYPINLLNVLYYTNKQNIALDAKGGKYFTFDGENYKLQSPEQIIDKYSINYKINYKNLKDYLNLKQNNLVTAVSINYMKEVI